MKVHPASTKWTKRALHVAVILALPCMCIHGENDPVPTTVYLSESLTQDIEPVWYEGY